jgi:hypothetical protein
MTISKMTAHTRAERISEARAIRVNRLNSKIHLPNSTQITTEGLRLRSTPLSLFSMKSNLQSYQ